MFLIVIEGSPADFFKKKTFVVFPLLNGRVESINTMFYILLSSGDKTLKVIEMKYLGTKVLC